MGCCDISQDGNPADCPHCSGRGRRVSAETLAALVIDPPEGAFRFCYTTDCPVVYYSESTRETIGADRLRVRVGQKETAPDRPICYCFGYSAADILADPTIPTQIARRCKAGEDACPRTNPQGACCLGNVQAVLREADAT